MTDQTLQETARVIHEQHAHDRKVADPAQTFTFGRLGTPDRVSQAVNLDLSDRLRIAPPQFSVRRGDTVRVVVSNSGTLQHRLLIGDLRYQNEHRLMRQVMPDSQHGGANAISVAPGGSSELLWVFDGPEDVEIVCHFPGHYEAGMLAHVRLE